MLREIEPSTVEDISSLDEEEQLKAQVLILSQRIASFIDRQTGRVEDVAMAQEMAQTIKPYIDRIVALERLLDPVDRIVDKREKIQKLQVDIADDVAEVEDLSDDMIGEIDTPLLHDLQGEIASIKRDRKLIVSQIDAEDIEPAVKTPNKPGSRALSDLEVPQRLERILGDRFISLSRLSQLLDTTFPDDFTHTYNRLLDRVWDTIFATKELKPHIEHSRIKTLKNTFEDYALLLRSPFLSFVPEDDTLPCTMENLRLQFEAYFLNVAERSLWYTRENFYRTPISQPHWALVDRQYLNCTFKKPSIRLLMYARANNLPARIVRQKSALEDIYDRIVLELALKKPFFEPCNSITSTTYQQEKNAPDRQVYVYLKDGFIRISGKRGTPHWRLTKTRWPGVLPAIIFNA